MCLGEVSAQSDGQVAAIQWQAGPLASANSAMDKLQSLLVDYPLREALLMAFAAAGIYSGDNRSEYAVCIQHSAGGDSNGDHAWMVISPQPN